MPDASSNPADFYGHARVLRMGDGTVQQYGYDLCPRLKSFPGRRLHVPKGDGIKIPESLKDVVLADISIEDIENGASHRRNRQSERSCCSGAWQVAARC
jgi:hypothetical protein